MKLLILFFEFIISFYYYFVVRMYEHTNWFSSYKLVPYINEVRGEFMGYTYLSKDSTWLFSRTFIQLTRVFQNKMVAVWIRDTVSS